LHANRLCAGCRRCITGALANDVAPGHELRRQLMFPADPLGTSTIRMLGVPSVAQLQACDSRDPPDLGVAMEGIYTRLGRPDIGLTAMPEMADIMALIRDRVSLPVIIDAGCIRSLATISSGLFLFLAISGPP
jgi:hypothetical protein